jgi:hypothetical protein
MQCTLQVTIITASVAHRFKMRKDAATERNAT